MTGVTELGREARLWEDTIVVALRDLQWISMADKAEGKLEIPPPFLKLDGNAESRIGDTPLRVDERYFILEVKSGLRQIQDEWWRRSKFNPKLVYLRLRALVDNLNATSSSKESEAVELFLSSMEMLQLSARGHHFVHWTEPDDGSPGFIGLLPYIEGVVSRTSKATSEKHHVLPRPDIDGPLALSYGKRGGNPVGIATIAMLREDDCIVGEDLSGRIETFGGLGLDRNEFQEYINFLCADAVGAAEPINAIVLSANGTFFRLVGNTSQLALLLDVQFKPSAKFDKVRRPRLRRPAQDLARRLAESNAASTAKLVAEKPSQPWHIRRRAF